MNARDLVMNVEWQRWFVLKEKGFPNSFEERDLTPLGDTVDSLGKMIVHYRVDSCMKINERKTRSWINIGKFWNVFVNWWFLETDILIGDISGPDTLGMTLLTFRHPTKQGMTLVGIMEGKLKLSIV